MQLEDNCPERAFSKVALKKKELTLEETIWAISKVLENDLNDCTERGFQKIGICS